jgi:hypothetical protein
MLKMISVTRSTTLYLSFFDIRKPLVCCLAREEPKVDIFTVSYFFFSYGVFKWAFWSALKNDQARSWIPENPTWSASKSGKEQLFCSTSGTECQMIQTSVKKKTTSSPSTCSKKCRIWICFLTPALDPGVEI